jgi:DNA-binding IclR family transcriptional regulator
MCGGAGRACSIRSFRPKNWPRSATHADEIRERQVELTPSKFVAGVTDISAPVMRGGDGGGGADRAVSQEAPALYIAGGDR